VLAEYIDEVQSLLNDTGGQFFPEPKLTKYINRSRRRIAAVSGCLRFIPPGVQSVPQQERYPFSHWKALVQDYPGADSILAVRSLAMAIGGRWERGIITGGGWKPMWYRLPWSDFQARFRQTNRTFIGISSQPGWWAQFGSGPEGELYLAPIPAQTAPIEVDCTLLCADLLTDDDVEPLPYPWSDAVPFWAAVMCLLQQQRREDAQAMASLFNSMLPECASVVCPTFLMNPYAATLRSA